MSAIYVVVRSIGEYSDKRVDNLFYFSTKDDALNWVEAAEKSARTAADQRDKYELSSYYDDAKWEKAYAKRAKVRSKMDPSLDQFDFSSVRYHVEVVEEFS